MPVDQYLEWLEYDSIEPIDPAGVIVRGLFGSKKTSGGWQAQKNKLLNHIAKFGKKK
jgi:hypothetical protein